MKENIIPAPNNIIPFKAINGSPIPPKTDNIFINNLAGTMKAKNFYIPDGIEYYMPSDAVKLEKIKSKILKIYAKYNYTYVIPPIFDNLENLLNLKSTKRAFLMSSIRSDELKRYFLLVPSQYKYHHYQNSIEYCEHWKQKSTMLFKYSIAIQSGDPLGLDALTS